MKDLDVEEFRDGFHGRCMQYVQDQVYEKILDGSQPASENWWWDATIERRYHVMVRRINALSRHLQSRGQWISAQMAWLDSQRGLLDEQRQWIEDQRQWIEDQDRRLRYVRRKRDAVHMFCHGVSIDEIAEKLNLKPLDVQVLVIEICGPLSDQNRERCKKM